MEPRTAIEQATGKRDCDGAAAATAVQATGDAEARWDTCGIQAGPAIAD
jgi:hypothetical protein